MGDLFHTGFTLDSKGITLYTQDNILFHKILRKRSHAWGWGLLAYSEGLTALGELLPLCCSDGQIDLEITNLENIASTQSQVPHPSPQLSLCVKLANTVWFWPGFDPILEPHDSFYSWAKFSFHRVLFPVQCTEGSNGQLSTPDWPSNDRWNFWHLWPQLYSDVTDHIGITNPVNCLSGGFCLNWDLWHCMWQYSMCFVQFMCCMLFR